MCDKTKPKEHWHKTRIKNEINEIAPNAFNCLGSIIELPDKDAERILSIILGYGCESQNAYPIVLSRELLSIISQDWLEVHLPEAISSSVNTSDEWEYRRLLELLEIAVPKLLPQYIEVGNTSDNEDVREAANDYFFKQNV